VPNNTSSEFEVGRFIAKKLWHGTSCNLTIGTRTWCAQTVYGTQPPMPANNTSSYTSGIFTVTTDAQGIGFGQVGPQKLTPSDPSVKDYADGLRLGDLRVDEGPGSRINPSCALPTTSVNS